MTMRRNDFLDTLAAVAVAACLLVGLLDYFDILTR